MGKSAKVKVPRKKRGWFVRWLRRLGLLLLLVLLVLVLAVWTGLGDRWARDVIVRRVEQMTGGKVELKAFRFHAFGLRAELDDFTIHGREPEGAPPFFHADRMVVDLRVESWFRRKVALDEVQVVRPVVRIRVDREGHSNVPAPKTQQEAGRPWRERVFDLAIHKLHIEEGLVEYNAARTPIRVQGGRFEFALDYTRTESGQPTYRGTLSWKEMILEARRYAAFRSDVTAKFALTSENFALTEFEWKLPLSELHATAQLESFAAPSWTFRYDGKVRLDELRPILRMPRMPGGKVEFTGEGSYAKGQADIRGRFATREITMPYTWFHAEGIKSEGNYHADSKRLEITDFRARVLGGELNGRVDLAYAGMRFRADTRLRGMSLARLLAAVAHRGFPVESFHWDGTVELDSIATWTQAFREVESRGEMRWLAAGEIAEGKIPAEGHFDYRVSQPRAMLELERSEITTATSRVEMDGRLGARGSSLAVQLDLRDLRPWNDFIAALRGPEAEHQAIAGQAEFRGRVEGPLNGPTFRGRVKGSNTAYGALLWDEVEGDITYSPAGFRMERGRARRGTASATLELWLELDDWAFRSASRWSVTGEFVGADTDGLQALMGTSYPARGLLTGQVRGGGTRAHPEVTALVDIADLILRGLTFERARGQLVLTSSEFRVNNAEMRKSSGRITGNLRYGFDDRQVAFDLAAAVVPLERIEWLQNPRFPLAGQASFQLRGGGPLGAPSAEGSLRVVDLRVGQDVLGSFEARLNSDSRRLLVDLSSAMAEGKLRGTLEVTLTDAYPVHGSLEIAALDLDAFIQAALHLPPGALTGHSRVDGRFGLSGALAQPATLHVRADITRLTLDYQQVHLENTAPVQLIYGADEIRVEQAQMRGPDSDFSITGSARFAGDRPLDLQLTGLINLRILRGFFRNLEARGSAQVNVAVEGTASRPRFNGRMRVENASASLADFPTGLSRLNGEFTFDRSGIVFENVTAEAGGGKLVLGGSVSYGEGILRYDLRADATGVRVRYPVGMSWLGHAKLRLAGTTRAAVLSGRVVIQRLLMSEGFDLPALFGVSQEPVVGPRTASPFLRNLQLDIEAVTSPDARMDWSAARFAIEARLRARGTWEQPILLGSVRLLSGQIMFRGNRYQLTRGDINFNNPVRIEPQLNLELTTTVQQYEITVNISGRANKLSLAFRSDPPLPQNEVLSLLALGRTTAEGEARSGVTGQTPEAGATTLLSEAISSQLGGRLERLFGISRFRIDPAVAGTGAEQNATARITVEQQLGRDVVITYVTNVSSTDYQIIQVEYLVSREASIIGLRDQNGTFGLDFKIKKRFR